MKKNSNVKRLFPVIIVVWLLICFGAYWFIFQSPNTSNTEHTQSLDELGLEALNPPQPMPAFNILQDDGFSAFSTEDLQGKTVIVNLWATWCPPCRAELPSMNRVWKKLKDKDVYMVAISVSESADVVDDFRKTHPIDFKLALDISGDMSRSWGMKGLPTTYIINKQGKIVYRTIGERNWDNEAFIKLIEHSKY